MKKMLSIVVVMAMVLVGYSVTANAASASKTLPLTLNVAAQFGFDVDKSSYAFDVPTGNLQTTIGIFAKSTNGNVWKMALNANPFTSGTNTLPSDPGFKCAAWSNADAEQAQGSFGVFAAAQIVPLTQTDFYTSTSAEGSDTFVPMVLGLYITVPSTQAAGVYATNLYLTMYE
ncbi:MAG: hypothetical protein KKD29_02580 [Candidatus Omnitrophica bacterium]|nr:hypothetical protein [Candidatus Omnitrophota bacterium]MBU4488983.1 hypothetical protein [Candidatus Omnitrophota bacterium]MCG2705695.1 hypothetical protein [Candidatus Omnitrophota bacterium]